MSEHQEREANDSGYELCVVTFIDVLGFRSLLASRTSTEISHILSLLEDITTPEEDRAERMEEMRLYSRAFAHSMSDAVVRVRTAQNQFNDGALCQELIDLLQAQLQLVGSGVLIRGGVAVGHVHIGYNGEPPVFGPGLVRAYEIESQEAIYPRIVIDDAALARHRTDEQLRAERNTLEYELGFLDSLLATGEDGTRYLDYLGAGKSEFDTLALYFQFLGNHATLVRQQLAQPSSLKVRRKYEWLARYHNRAINNLIRGYREDPESERIANEECATNVSELLTRLLLNELR